MKGRLTLTSIGLAGTDVAPTITAVAAEASVPALSGETMALYIRSWMKRSLLSSIRRNQWFGGLRRLSYRVCRPSAIMGLIEPLKPYSLERWQALLRVVDLGRKERIVYQENDKAKATVENKIHERAAMSPSCPSTNIVAA